MNMTPAASQPRLLGCEVVDRHIDQHAVGLLRRAARLRVPIDKDVHSTNDEATRLFVARQTENALVPVTEHI
jgi:hypothetical protein